MKIDKIPSIMTELPGPEAKKVLEKDQRFVSQSYTGVYPLVVKRARGTVVEAVDSNRFLDFTSGIAFCNTGHCHPRVVEAIHRQAEQFIHMSGTDFYYDAQSTLTYLAWFDFSGLGISDPYKFLLKNAKIALNDGAAFGTGGKGFVRFNFGTSRSLVTEGLERMRKAVETHDPE